MVHQSFRQRLVGAQESEIDPFVRDGGVKLRDTIPANRLLVFAPSDGWGPLCRFLGVPVPATDFPRSNARAEFWALFGGEPIAA